MEKVGFVTLLDRLLEKGIPITGISTDRHVQIRKLMATNPAYAHITHTIDPWHLIKGIKKKLNAKSKKKGCDVIGRYSILDLSTSFLKLVFEGS